MRIIYYDLIAPKGIHASFNAGLINVLYEWQNRNNDITVHFHSEESHGNIVSRILRNENIYIILKPCKILIKSIVGGWKTPLRDILGIYYVITAFISRHKHNEEILVFGLVYPFSLKAINFCSQLLKKKVFVCLHGEMSVFVNKVNFHRNKKYFSLMKNDLIKENKYIKYIVLGEPIYDVIRHVFLNKPIIINLPYIFNNKNIINNNFEPLIVGQIGNGDKGKGTHYLFEIARIMKKEIIENKIRFILVGKLSNELQSLDEGLVEYRKEIVEQDVFESMIQRLHFSLQLRDSSTAQATASATFIDTLKFDKPFLSLNNNYINYYLSQENLQKYAFNSIDDIIGYLKRFIDLNDKEKIYNYNIMLSDIQKLKNYFSIKHNAKLLSNQYIH